MEEKSQEKLVTKFFESQPQPAIWLTPVYQDGVGKVTDFEYSYCNDASLRYVDLKKDQLIGQRLLSFDRLTNNETKKRFFEETLTVFETGLEVQGTVYNSVLNKYYSFIRTRVEDGVLIIIQDRNHEYQLIDELEKQKQQLLDEKAEQKKTLLEIEKQKTLLDGILKSSPSGIVVTEGVRNEAGKIIDWKIIVFNEASTILTGFTKEEILQKTVCELIPDLWGSSLSQQSLATLQEGAPFSIQYHHLKLNKWLDISVAKMDDNHLINVFTDVTAAKNAEIQLQKSVDALNRSNANLEEFAYAASHDLKEPIRKVRTFGERLKEKLLSRMTEQEVQMFTRMEKATERMELLVEDLLSFSHVSFVTSGLEEIDLSERVKRVLEDLEMAINEKGAIVTVDKLPVIKGYKRQLQQLFQNLISNAIKYSKPGIAPEIHVHSLLVAGKDAPIEMKETDERKLFHVIKVADNGIGFEQQYAEKIFQMFQRLHGKNEYSGTGIGLSIVKKVVEIHNGYITAESEPGEGSIFSVYLPA